MDFQSYFPVWNKLTPAQQERILGSLMERRVSKGTVIHNGSMDCTGLLLVKSGQLRAYILSDEGREITIYRLFDRDMCLFSASCIMRSIQFEVTVEAEKDTDLWVIQPDRCCFVLQTDGLFRNTGQFCRTPLHSGGPVHTGNIKLFSLHSSPFFCLYPFAGSYMSLIY